MNTYTEMKSWYLGVSYGSSFAYMEETFIIVFLHNIKELSSELVSLDYQG